VHRARGRGQARNVLLDEPTSALDPISTAKIEELVTS
jgi:ABC-type phosphate transport system ATPase subunit